MSHPRTDCPHTSVGDTPSPVVCIIKLCLPNSHVGVCRKCEHDKGKKLTH